MYFDLRVYFDLTVFHTDFYGYGHPISAGAQSALAGVTVVGHCRRRAVTAVFHRQHHRRGHAIGAGARDRHRPPRPPRLQVFALDARRSISSRLAASRSRVCSNSCNSAVSSRFSIKPPRWACIAVRAALGSRVRRLSIMS